MKTDYKLPSTAITLGAMLAIGLTQESSAPVTQVKPLKAIYYVDQTLSTMGPAVWVLDVSQPAVDGLAVAMTDFYERLSGIQSRLPAEIEQILDENSWELYAKTT